MHGMGMQMKVPEVTPAKKENVQPSKQNFTFQVVDYEKPQE